jgi:pimeloyl-ACP methyl ester carboxylesterase
VLLNGGLMTIASWDRFAGFQDRALADQFRLIRCDFRGQLLSPGEPEPTLDAHVDDLLALLDALEIPSAHLAGVSFGALVALRLAAREPDRATSLTAITATDQIPVETWRDTVEMRELALAAAAGGDGGKVLDFLLPRTYTPEYLESQTANFAFYRQWIAGLPPVWFRGLARILSALEGLDLGPDLGAIRCPTLIVGAEGDHTFPPEHSLALAAGIHGARLEILRGGSHGLIVEQADRVLDLLLDFLTRDAARHGEMKSK